MALPLAISRAISSGTSSSSSGDDATAVVVVVVVVVVLVAWLVKDGLVLVKACIVGDNRRSKTTRFMVLQIELESRLSKSYYTCRLHSCTGKIAREVTMSPMDPLVYEPTLLTPTHPFFWPFESIVYPFVLSQCELVVSLLHKTINTLIDRCHFATCVFHRSIAILQHYTILSYIAILQNCHIATHSA